MQGSLDVVVVAVETEIQQATVVSHELLTKGARAKQALRSAFGSSLRRAQQKPSSLKLPCQSNPFRVIASHLA